MRKPMYKMTYTEKVELALKENWNIEMCNRYGVDVKDVVRKGKEKTNLKINTIQELENVWLFYCGNIEFSNCLKTKNQLKGARMVLRSMGENIGLIDENEGFDNIELLGKILELKEELSK